MKKIAVFASGTGTNVENLINYFKKHTSIALVLVVSNNEHCGAIDKAKNNNIQTLVLSKDMIVDGDAIARNLNEFGIDYIVLAGYLKMIPAKLIQQFQEKIINVHPSLLPKYGGKGMYGKAVHKAVAENKETESGITIHFVNEEYDKGKIIAQRKTTLSPYDTYLDVENKVRALEIEWLPVIVESVILAKPIT